MTPPENEECVAATENAVTPAAQLRPAAAGEKLITLAVDGRVRSRDEIVQEVQDYFCSLATPDRVLSEELIAERRQEFLKEEAEFGASPPYARQ